VDSALRPRLDAIATPEAVAVHDGLLTLTTYTDASGRHHTGFVGTQGVVEVTYGYFEARIRFNDSPGGWCAFWIDSPTNGDPMAIPARRAWRSTWSSTAPPTITAGRRCETCRR
jgi:hypothetical protein